MPQTPPLAVGDIAYFIDGAGWDRRIIPGIVAIIQPNDIYLDLMEPVRNIYIDDTPVSAMEFPTRWRKIPKNWTYDTELFRKETRVETVFRRVNYRDPTDIKNAIDEGVLRIKQLSYKYEAEIDRNLGWRIIEVPRQGYLNNRTSVRRSPTEVFCSYSEARIALDAEMAELERQKNLTDEEWSLEQICHDLDRWKSLFGISDHASDKALKFFLLRKDLVDLETRIYDGTLQWKHWKNKKWNNINDVVD